MGSDPISKLGKFHNGIKLKITACDPLANYYAEILRALGVVPPIRTIQAFAEDLSCYFEKDWFDMVVCTNALDHSFEPMRGLVQMLEVVKLGGTVLLQHRLREAKSEKYAGFHQWNFDRQDGRFIMWNRTERIDVAEHIAPFAEVTVEDLGWVVVTIRKTAPVVAPQSTDMRARIRALLNSMLALSHTRGGMRQAFPQLACQQRGNLAPTSTFRTPQPRRVGSAAAPCDWHNNNGLWLLRHSQGSIAKHRGPRREGCDMKFVRRDRKHRAASCIEPEICVIITRRFHRGEGGDANGSSGRRDRTVG